MKPGPAISIDSTQRCDRRLGAAARRSARPRRSRGLRLSGLASCIAAVTARSPWAACSGVRRRRERAGRGPTSASAARSACEQFFGLGSSADSTRRPSHQARRTRSHAKRACSAMVVAPRGRRADARWPRLSPLMSVASRPPNAAAEHRRRSALPARIGKYRVLSRLGDGATSEVFLGRDDFHERDVAIKRVRADRWPTRSTATTSSASSPPRPRWWAACTTPTSCRSTTRWPTRPSPTWYGVRGRQHAAPVLPRRPAAAARADRRDRLQVRDGARLRVPPGPDPPRRQAGQPARRDGPTARSPT